jgi:hypothetical protein
MQPQQLLKKDYDDLCKFLDDIMHHTNCIITKFDTDTLNNKISIKMTLMFSNVLFDTIHFKLKSLREKLLLIQYNITSYPQYLPVSRESARKGELKHELELEVPYSYDLYLMLTNAMTTTPEKVEQEKPLKGNQLERLQALVIMIDEKTKLMDAAKVRIEMMMNQEVLTKDQMTWLNDIHKCYRDLQITN